MSYMTKNITSFINVKTKFYVFIFSDQQHHNCYVFKTFRRDGLCGNYICGLSPPPEEEPSVDNLDVDHSYFDNTLWPILAHRVPAFEAVKVN